MRILQIGPFPPPYGGVERNLAAIRTFLRQRRIPCAVINITRHRANLAEDVFHPQGIREVFGLLRRMHADVIHIHFGGMITGRLLALYLVCALWPGRRTVLTFHSGGYPASPEGQALTRWSPAAFVFRRLHGVIAVNAEIAAFFRRLGVSSRRIRVIAPHAFVAGEGLSDALPEPLATFAASHSPLLVSVGGLEPEYDVAAQIDVLAAIRAVHPRAGLAVIGSGSREVELRTRAAGSPASDGIMLCGDVPHASTMRAIAQADVLLRTTLYDGDAISVREALHLDTPVVATDNGMRPAGVTVVPVADAAALRTAVLAVLAAPRAARAAAVRPEESNLEAVLTFYQDLTNDATSGRASGRALNRPVPERGK